MAITLNGSTGITTPTETVSGLSSVGSLSVGGATYPAPGTSGNVMTSNGTNWTSSALPAGGVTSLNGQTGAITNTSLYAIGSYAIGRPANASNYAVNTTIAGSSLYEMSPGTFWESGFTTAGKGSVSSGPNLINTGTWRCMSDASGTSGGWGMSGLWVRIS